MLELKTDLAERTTVKQKDMPPPRSLVFTRAAWKHVMRYVGAFILIMLNIAMVMSTIQLHAQNRALDAGREIFSFLVVFAFDVTILLPILMEVHGVEIKPDSIVFRTLWGNRQYLWGQIRGFSNPVYLNYVVMRTGCWIYLINKRDIGQIDELVQIIQGKLGKLIK